MREINGAESTIERARFSAHFSAAETPRFRQAESVTERLAFSGAFSIAESVSISCAESTTERQAFSGTFSAADWGAFSGAETYTETKDFSEPAGAPADTPAGSLGRSATQVKKAKRVRAKREWAFVPSQKSAG